MATIVITFFLFARFNVYKMDADCKEKRRGWCFLPTKIVEQQDRFAMDPQRFEEILAEITTGYGNIRSSFENVNIAEILEEMVTEFARTALESSEAPKFTELAVLLQHCAQLYGRKVDYLYQHVLDVCDALAGAGAPQDAAQDASPAPARKRRRASTAAATAAGFSHIILEPSPSATRLVEPLRPPPTLPRMYIELEPRVASAHDAPLRDLDGEPVGLPADYHVTWRMRDGYLVDELEAPLAPTERPALRPLSLLELQEALAAAAPPDPPPLMSPRPPSTLPPSSPPRVESPPPAHSPSPEETPTLSAAVLAQRKRRSTLKLADIIDTPVKMFKVDQWQYTRRAEFSPPAAWLSRVTAARVRRLLHVREHLTHNHKKFRGFEDMHPEKGGFPGWSPAEVAEAAETAYCASLRHTELESDDDGFFENSSFSSLDSTQYSPRVPPPAPPSAGVEAARAADAAWSARVAARAAAQEARGGVDVRALGAAVLAALPAPSPRAPLPFPCLLRRAAHTQQDVSRLLLATLFLANSGNVEISPEAGGAFSVTLLSTDQRQFAAAAEAEAGLQAPAPPPHPA